MKLITQPNDQCLLYAAAMLLNEDPEKLKEEIGHDGMEIWWPDVLGKYCFRNFHIQEIQDCCLSRGFGLVLIEKNPCSKTLTKPVDIKIIHSLEEAAKRFYKSIKNNPGLLITLQHACAWDGQGKIYDPRGFITNDFSKYDFLEAWLLFKSNQSNRKK